MSLSRAKFSPKFFQSRMNGQVVSFHGFDLDYANRVLRRAGEPLPLPGKAFDVLCFLLENRGRLVSKNEIIDAVWMGQAVEEANLSVQISQVRKVLGDDPRKPKLIETVPRFGYRLNAESAPASVVVETFERVTIEHRAGRNIERPGVLVAAGALAAVVLVAVAGYFFWPRPETGVRSAPGMARLTNNGRVGVSAISRDGRLLAYTVSETGGTALWVRQVGVANDRRIVEPQTAEIWSVTFDPSGSEIFYVTFAGDKVDPELHRIPSFGGPASVVPGTYAHSISFSPDGSRFAYVLPNSAENENYLIVQNRDGSGKAAVATRPQPSTFVYDGHFATWDPTGDSIAVAVNRFEEESNHNAIVLVDPNNGAERPLGGQKWFDVRAIEWAADGEGLYVSASNSPASANRVWYQPRDGSEPRPLTDDLSVYDSVSVGGPGDTFTARQTSSLGSIAVGMPDKSFDEVFSEVGWSGPTRWTSSGKLVFRSFADGTPNLWLSEADGSNRRQLTTDAQVDERGMCVTADDRFIVYVSWLGGKSNLWRVGMDGGGTVRLTTGDADAFPACTPDGRSVIFQRGLLSRPALWRVPIDGGEAVRLTDYRAKWGSVSRDGRSLAFVQMKENRWRIGIADSGGKPDGRHADVPGVMRGNRFVWSEDGFGLFFSGSDGEAEEIWSLSLADGKPIRLTKFGSGRIRDFDIGTDGRFAVARSRSLSDVVRIARP